MGRNGNKPKANDASQRMALADALSGVIGSLVSVLAFYPVDVWKTRLQAGLKDSVDPKLTNEENIFGENSLIREKNAPSIFQGDEKRISRTLLSPKLASFLLPDISHLLVGLPQKLTHATISSFTYFFVYSLVQSSYSDYRKSSFYQQQHQKQNLPLEANAKYINEVSAAEKLLLTAFAAVVNTCLTFPFDTLAARKQTGSSTMGNRRTNRGEDNDAKGAKITTLHNSTDCEFDGSCKNSIIGSCLGKRPDVENCIAQRNSVLKQCVFEEDSGRNVGRTCDHHIPHFGDQNSSNGRTQFPLTNDCCESNSEQQRRFCIKSPEKLRLSQSTSLSIGVSTATIDSENDEAYRNSTRNDSRQSVQYIISLWNGLLPAILLCTNPAIQYTMFDTLKKLLLQHRPERNFQHGLNGNSDSTRLSIWEAFFFGLISKFVATIATYPLIRAKVLLMVASVGEVSRDDHSSRNVSRATFLDKDQNFCGALNETKSASMSGCFPSNRSYCLNKGTSKSPPHRPRKHQQSLLSLLFSIFQTEGINGLYRGCSLQLLHTVLKSALLMAVREKIMFSSRRFFQVEGA